MGEISMGSHWLPSIFTQASKRKQMDSHTVKMQRQTSRVRAKNLLVDRGSDIA